MSCEKERIINTIMSPWIDRVDIVFLYNLGFEHAKVNLLVNKELGVSVHFFSDLKRIYKKKSFLYKKGKELCLNSFCNCPSYVIYDDWGEVKKCTYHLEGKKHSVAAQPEINNKEEIFFWNNGIKNNQNVKLIFDYFNLAFNYENYLKIHSFLEVYYKNTDNVNWFLQLLKEHSFKKDDVNKNDMISFLNVAYF